MKILLVEPLADSKAIETSKCIEKKSSFYIPLTLPYLAALIEGIDDTKIVLDSDFYEQKRTPEELATYDLIGISAQTTQLKRALKIAVQCSKLGVPTILGGPVTVEDNHSLVKMLGRFFTSVAIGESEMLWEMILKDIKNSSLKKTYQAPSLVSLENLPIPNFDLIDFQNYKEPYVLPIMASRGCPRKCSFCSEFLYGTWRLRPIQEVFSELEFIKNKFNISCFAFRDNNFLVNQRRSEDLVKKIQSLNIEWSCQTDLNLADNEKLVALLLDSGLKSISFGLESIILENRKNANKSFFSMDKARSLLLCLHNAGIETQVNIIFGFDWDHPEVFDKTVDFLLKSKVSLFFPSILFPIPGTPLYNQLNREGRLLNTTPPSIGNSLFVNFIPKNMSAEELRQGYLKAKENFYNNQKNTVFWLNEKENIWGTAVH